MAEDDSHESDHDHSDLFAEEIGLGRPIDITGQDFKKIEEQIKDLKKADYDSSLSHFRKCQEHKFRAKEFEELLPDAWNGACEVAQGYSVPASWALLCQTSLTAMLLPTVMLQPIPTLPVHHVLWTFVIHPGSVNTSRLFGLFNDVLLELTDKENQEREELLKAECEQISSKATAAGKKGKVSRVPPPRWMSSGALN